jgi:Protein of unknown function (DUF2946)
MTKGTWPLRRRRRGSRKSDAIAVNRSQVLFVFRTHPSSSGNSVSVGRPRTRRLSSMNWFRLRIRSGARLALFALAVQMVLSFGHLHRDDLGLPPLAGTDQTSIASNAAPGSQPPAGQHHQPASDDYCPICASVALLATWMPALPPVLVTPDPIRRVLAPLASWHSPPTQISLSFQARAPPVV